MGIVPVEKGQKLTAQAWNQLATTVNNIAGGSTAAASAGKVVQVTIKNNTSAAVQAGNILTVYRAGTVRLAQYTPDEARIAWMNNGFQLDGWGSGANGVPALLIDGIDEGGIGRALVYGLCAGYVTVSGSSAPDTVVFNASSGVFAVPSSGQTADWKIIAASSVSGGKAFCYMIPLGGGGGETSGVNIALLSSPNSGYTSAYILLQGISRAVSNGKNVLIGPNFKLANTNASGLINYVENISVDTTGNLVVTTKTTKLIQSFTWD